MAGASREGGTPSAGSKGESVRRRGEELIVGRLVAHGAAPYQYRNEEGPSYYLKLLTSQGPRTLWGKDLERALKEGATQPKEGELIGARRQSRQAVTLTQRIKDEQGQVVSTSERVAHRSVWQVEKVTYFAERSRLAKRVREDQTYDKATIKQHPELRSSFLSVRAAEEFAKARIANPEDRERFLVLIRGALSTSIHEGSPLPNVKLRDKSQTAAVVPLHKKPEEPTR
jgi:hypothetical protein